MRFKVEFSPLTLEQARELFALTESLAALRQPSPMPETDEDHRVLEDMVMGRVAEEIAAGFARASPAASEG